MISIAKPIIESEEKQAVLEVLDSWYKSQLASALPEESQRGNRGDER